MLHEFFPDMPTDPVGLQAYWDWACEHAYGSGGANCTEINSAAVQSALSEQCLYDPAITTCSSCPTGVTCATLPAASRRRRLSNNGRELGHGSANSMCHPATATLTRCDGSLVRIDAAAVGDSILTPLGCEPITGLFHADAEVMGTYHRFFTQSGASLAISDDHWLVNGAEADPATVKPGDLLNTINNVHDPVVRIETAPSAALSTSLSPRALTTSTASLPLPTLRVPLGIWKIFADGYASLRYEMGMPITPEGKGYFSITWPLAAYDKLGVPPDAATTFLWPLTAVAAALTELVNASPAVFVALASVVAMHKLAPKPCKVA